MFEEEKDRGIRKRKEK